MTECTSICTEHTIIAADNTNASGALSDDELARFVFVKSGE